MSALHNVGRQYRWVRVAVGAGWVLAVFGTAAVFWGVYFVYGDGTLPDHAMWILIGTVFATAAWIMATMAISVLVGFARAAGFLVPND